MNQVQWSKNKSSETIKQVEIQDVIGSDMEAEMDCTDEDSELGVNKTEWKVRKQQSK